MTFSTNNEWTKYLSEFDWNRTEPYDPKELLSMMYKVVENGFYGTNHPLAISWLAGELSKEELQFMGIQEYWYFRCTVWWNAGKVLHCPDLEDQRLLLGPLAEEAGIGDEPHEKQFIRYLQGIGVDMETVFNTGVLPQTITCVDEFYNLNSYGKLIESLAANNLVAEIMRPKQYPLVLESYQKHYTWVPDDALVFFRTHSEADIEHAEIGEKLFLKYAKSMEAQQLAWSALTRSLAARWCLYDGILQYIKKKTSPLLPLWRAFPVIGDV